MYALNNHVRLLTWFFNDYRLWELGTTYFYKIFPSLIPVNSHIKPTNNDLVLKELHKPARPLEIQSYAWQCFGNCCLIAWFNLTLTPTISSSIVAIDIDSCSVIITSFAWPCCCMDPTRIQLPLHNNKSLKQEENSFIITLQPPRIVT